MFPQIVTTCLLFPGWDPEMFGYSLLLSYGMLVPGTDSRLVPHAWDKGLLWHFWEGLEQRGSAWSWGSMIPRESAWNNREHASLCAVRGLSVPSRRWNGVLERHLAVIGSEELHMFPNQPSPRTPGKTPHGGWELPRHSAAGGQTLRAPQGRTSALIPALGPLWNLHQGTPEGSQDGRGPQTLLLGKAVKRPSPGSFCPI